MGHTSNHATQTGHSVNVALESSSKTHYTTMPSLQPYMPLQILIGTLMSEPVV